MGSGRARTFVPAAAGLLLAAACLVSCGTRSEYDKSDHTLLLTVRTAGGQPVRGVTAKIWILDQDVRAGARTPIEMPEQTTDFEGHADWVYAAFEMPTICGFAIEDAQGTSLKSSAPSPANRLDVPPGQLTITLD
jgi:hypothetical protein